MVGAAVLPLSHGNLHTMHNENVFLFFNGISYAHNNLWVLLSSNEYITDFEGEFAKLLPYLRGSVMGRFHVIQLFDFN